MEEAAVAAGESVVAADVAYVAELPLGLVAVAVEELLAGIVRLLSPAQGAIVSHTSIPSVFLSFSALSFSCFLAFDPLTLRF